jgi:PAS domain S-box-containing protein
MATSPPSTTRIDPDAQNDVMRLVRSVERVYAAGAVGASPLLRRSRYREFLDAVAVAIYTTDAAGRITFFNEAAARFWGRRPELGEEWCGSWRLFWTDGRPMAHSECPMAIALLENREVRGFQAIAERPDGTRASFVPYPTPLRDQTGRLIGAVNVLVDVTERVQAEAAVLASADALRASNAVKDEFLGLVSHELRTPVTTIFGNAELLRRSPNLSAERRDGMLEDIAADAARLRDVVENLLLLTRLGPGAALDREPVMLGRALDEAVTAFRQRHPARTVHVVAAGSRDVIVETDPTCLRVLVDNLIGNAHKYSDMGHDIDVVMEVDAGEAHVRVFDRGIGIAATDPELLFTPFYRADEAKAHAGGVGVGLAVCKRIVEAAGGRIWARARDDGGSEFGFALPTMEL